jgi:hypothetical protein
MNSKRAVHVDDRGILWAVSKLKIFGHLEILAVDLSADEVILGFVIWELGHP